VTLSPVLSLSHVLPCLPALKLSSLHLVIFKFSAINSACHFLHIYPLDFHLKNILWPLNSKKILWSNKFFKVPLVEFIFLKIKMAFASYETFDFES
jgi:hypothetical protein